ncbi:MAG: hypothetical protein IPM92_03865 [Saprospiraceae bacterium]|nr:hypothetical protein [Saprospiraceae bacterium]
MKKQTRFNKMSLFIGDDVNSHFKPMINSSHKKIVYLVSHGFAARMLTQTNLIGKLSANGNTLSLICPDSNDPVLKAYCQEWNINLLSFKSNKYIWRTNYSLYRTYFLEDVKSNQALFEKHYYEMHRMKSRFAFLKFVPRFLIIVHVVFCKFPFLKRLYSWLEKLLLKDQQAVELLNKLAPDIVISTYPANIQEGVLLFNASRKKIKTVIHLLSWDNITSKGRFYSMADHYMVWGPIMRKELQQYYSILNENIFECGVPHFDLHHQIKTDLNRDQYILDTGIQKNKPYLLFGMSSPRFVPCEIDIVENLAAKIENDFFGPDLQMLIRPHPQNVQGGMADKSWLPRLQKLESKRVRVFYPLLAESKMPWSMERLDMNKLAAALSGCLVCINSCSTLSIDALMAEKSSIAPMFDGHQTLPYWSSAKRLLKYIHIDKLIQFKGIEVADNYNEMDHLIKMYQTNAEEHYQIAKYAKIQECGMDDGMATEKVIACVERLVS